jgi:UDP-2-acetamido-3-amino-2,3-dideoxy-glucuronate N-acetyltransferase
VFDDTRPWAQKLLLHRDYLVWAGGRTPTPAMGGGEVIDVPEAEPLRQECIHFLRACRERLRPRTGAAEGMRVLQVLKMAQRSLERDGELVAAVRRRLPSSSYFAHPTAVVDEGAAIGAGTKVWHFSHIMKGAQIGERCVLGQNVNVDGGVRIGNNVKVQNNVSIYTGTEIEDDVFLGPSCVLTNVANPRSQVNRHELYERTVLMRGATVGANATIVSGVTLGRYCFVAAGAVVTKDVPDYALMIGNPARQRGWMSRHGHVLKPGPDGVLSCPESQLRYREDPPGTLRCLDLDENSPLPDALAVGAKRYRELKGAQV